MDFSPQFQNAICSGAKTATSRLLGENDPHTDIKDLIIGTAFVATCACTSLERTASVLASRVDTSRRAFAILRVREFEDRIYSLIDDKLAKIENCETPKELQTLLRQFYPDVKDTDTLRVIYFEFVERL